MRLSALAALVVLAAAPAAQPVEGARLVVKEVYSLASGDDAPPLGELRRAEIETYGPGGQRHRVEWRGPDGEILLTFVELYASADAARPYGAFYVEGDLDPTLERFEYRDDGRVKRVTYLTAAGEVTGVNEFVTDAEGREVERRYGVSDDGPRSTDTVSYEGPNATGYVNERADGSSRVAYTFRIEAVDAQGRWTRRVISRDGAARSLEVRTITDAE